MNLRWKIGITNFVTLLRIVGIFALIPIFFNIGGIATFIISALCFLTDFLDGFLARNLKCSTFFGSLFDAFSDKAFLIVNLILLITISSYAIIPILLEVAIAIIQSIKFNQNLNVHANIIGKSKMWVAGISICFCYLIKDINIEIDKNIIIMVLIVLLAISQIATFISYVIEYKREKKKITQKVINEKKKEEKELEAAMQDKTLTYIWFSPEFYSKYKDHGNLKLIRNFVKKVRK